MPSDPRKVYKMRPVIEAVVDRDSFFEIGRAWGKSIITGLARLDGVPVALFAEDPFVYGGAWTADACRKLTRFIDLSAIFHLPLVHLVDCPGFLIGKQSEEDSTIRFGSTTLAALGQSPYRSQAWWCARRSAWPARRITSPAAITSAWHGRRAIGARCRSKAASKWPTRPNSRNRPIRTRISPRSRRA